MRGIRTHCRSSWRHGQAPVWRHSLGNVTSQAWWERSVFSFSSGPGKQPFSPHTQPFPLQSMPCQQPGPVLWLRTQRRAPFVVYEASDCISGRLCKCIPGCDNSCLPKAASKIYFFESVGIQHGSPRSLPLVCECGERISFRNWAPCCCSLIHCWPLMTEDSALAGL